MAVPVDSYCYIKAVAAVRGISGYEVFTDLIQKHRDVLNDLVDHGETDYHWMVELGAIWDDGEWHIIIDDHGKTKTTRRVALFDFVKRVDEEYQKNKHEAALVTERVQAATKLRRLPSATAVAGPTLSPGDTQAQNRTSRVTDTASPGEARGIKTSSADILTDDTDRSQPVKSSLAGARHI